MTTTNKDDLELITEGRYSSSRNKNILHLVLGDFSVKTNLAKITHLILLLLLPFLGSCSFLNRYGYIDKSGHQVIKGAFDNVGDFSEGLARVSVSKKYGFIDRGGKFVIDPQFSFAYNFKEGLAVVDTRGTDKRGNGCGYIDKSGKLVIKPLFSTAHNFSEGLAYALIVTTPNNSSDWKYGYIDKTGEFVIHTDGDVGTYGGDFKEGLAPVIKMPAHKWGYINKTGKFIIKPQFDEAYDFSEGLAKVVINGSTAYIDHQGRSIVKVAYQVVDQHRGNFSDGMAAIKKGDKWGYIDRNGEEVVRPQFTEAGDFADGLAVVNVGAYWHPATGLLSDNIKGYYGGGKCWAIDKSGTKVALEGEPLVQNSRFSEGLLPVRINKAWGYVDKTGKAIIGPQWDFTCNFHEGLAAVYCKTQ